MENQGKERESLGLNINDFMVESQSEE